jgi:hypothetical protein
MKDAGIPTRGSRASRMRVLGPPGPVYVRRFKHLYAEQRQPNAEALLAAVRGELSCRAVWNLAVRLGACLSRRSA